MKHEILQIKQPEQQSNFLFCAQDTGIPFLQLRQTQAGFDMVIPDDVTPNDAAREFIKLVEAYILRREPLVLHAEEMFYCLQLQHEAIDILFARLANVDSKFYPTESGLPWKAVEVFNALKRKIGGVLGKGRVE